MKLKELITLIRSNVLQPIASGGSQEVEVGVGGPGHFQGETVRVVLRVFDGWDEAKQEQTSREVSVWLHAAEAEALAGALMTAAVASL